MPLCRVLTIPPVGAETSLFRGWAALGPMCAAWQPFGWPASWVIPLFRHLDHAESRLCGARNARERCRQRAMVPSQDVLHRLAVGKLKAGEKADTSAIGRELMWRRGVGRRDERGI